MKKLVVLFVIFSIVEIASAEFALEKISISGYLGYVNVSMGDVKNSLDSSPINQAPFKNNVVSNVGDGTIVGVEGMYKLDEVIPGFAAGARLAYLTCTPGTVTGEITAGRKTKQTIELGLTMLMVGAGYTKELSDVDPNLSVTGTVFLGLYSPLWGAFKMESNDPLVTSVTNLNGETTLEGSCMPIDINIKGNYKIAEKISINFGLGYRIASVSEIKTGNDNANLDITKGELLKDASGNTITADFTGTTLSVGVTYQF